MIHCSISLIIDESGKDSIVTSLLFLKSEYTPKNIISTSTFVKQNIRLTLNLDADIQVEGRVQNTVRQQN